MRFCNHAILIATVALSVLAPSVRPLVAQQNQDVRLSADADKLAFFERKIRPILVQHCYECHSAESDTIQAGLRLDSQPGWVRGGDSGPALVPGHPDQSLLIDSIKYESFEMPPDGRLNKQVIADFERWIREGAVDPRTSEPERTEAQPALKRLSPSDWWVLQPLSKPQIPAVKDAEWCRTPIDHFIRSRQEQADVAPGPDANPETLARRLAFDLTGLPPTREQIQALQHRSSQETNAAEAEVLIHELLPQFLHSAQFGVHWGRHWLDVTRYADSNGSDFNATFRSAWRYRDYVVESFNQDRPFDQFVKSQIAGDLLPFENDQQRREQITATGFLMVGAKMLSERDKDKLRMDIVDEQIDTIGRVFLGMTVGCARCHDHKFDPLDSRDYYALAGILGSTVTIEGESQKYVSTWVETDLPVAPEWKTARIEFETRTSEIDKELKQIQKRLAKLTEQKQEVGSADGSVTIDDAAARKMGNWISSTFSPNYVGESYLHDGNTNKGQATIVYEAQLPATGTYDVQLSYTPGSGRAARVPIEIVTSEGTRQLTFNQVPKPSVDQLYTSVGTFEFSSESIAKLTISNRGTSGYVIADAVRFVPVDVERSERSETEAAAQARAEAARIQSLIDEQEHKKTELETEREKLASQAPPELPTAMAAREAPEVGDCRLRIRGEVHRQGDVIPRGFIAALPGGDVELSHLEQSGRLQLAEWLVAKQNPVTARVIANRIWQHVMGRGLVTSVDNFGQLGSFPTHPDLLDYLACELREHDWSIKHVIQLIVESHVYRLSSVPTEAATTIDPENRWYSRAIRKRLPAESIRDAMLAASDRLDTTLGGSSVTKYKYLAVATSGVRSTDVNFEGFTRRSLYMPLIRNDLPPVLRVFDYPDPDLVSGQRASTTVPAQALYLLNSTFVRQCAEQLAAQLLHEFPYDSRRRVRAAWQATLSRSETDEEVRSALKFLDQALVDGQSEHQALTLLVHSLMASTEFRMCD